MNFLEIFKGRIDLRKNSFVLSSLLFLFCTFPCFNMMPKNNLLNKSSQKGNQTFIRYIYYFSDQSAVIF